MNVIRSPLQGLNFLRELLGDIRVEDRLMSYLLAHELLTKIIHEPIDLHYKFNTFSIIFVPLCPVTYNIIYL